MSSHQEIARQVITQQAAALEQLARSLGDAFDQAVDLLLGCKGRVIVCGMGKSGLVGRKMSATFASTGTPSFFLHPGEALHGDLGKVMSGDVIVLISNSGETEEVLRLLPSLQDFGNDTIAITNAPASTLARYARITLTLHVEREACPNNLAPTTSTLATMALGDALAVALISARDFQPQDFARYHPGGSLGRRLLTRVADVMHKDLPIVAPDTPMAQVIEVMTEKRLGLAIVLEEGRLAGILTDGDLRRAMRRVSQVLDYPAREFMTPNPVTIAPGSRMTEAEQLMHERSIRALVVVEAGVVLGVVDIFN
ncbi:SIS domain-containing protein [Azovibrio restrictus]|uniref:KpsF/GutQ family sugar-phosphate isomerase n=1 Tax=Azovibrio restrictus TaxID=146938 RepID=UPI0026EC3399|nr:KpsF/GutQ family sugar-phosphate isomerase [Azovibrio restrictus]